MRLWSPKVQGFRDRLRRCVDLKEGAETFVEVSVCGKLCEVVAWLVHGGVGVVWAWGGGDLQLKSGSILSSPNSDGLQPKSEWFLCCVFFWRKGQHSDTRMFWVAGEESRSLMCQSIHGEEVLGNLQLAGSDQSRQRGWVLP